MTDKLSAERQKALEWFETYFTGGEMMAAGDKDVA